MYQLNNTSIQNHERKSNYMEVSQKIKFHKKLEAKKIIGGQLGRKKKESRWESCVFEK